MAERNNVTPLPQTRPGGSPAYNWHDLRTMQGNPQMLQALLEQAGLYGQVASRLNGGGAYRGHDGGADIADLDGYSFGNDLTDSTPYGSTVNEAIRDRDGNIVASRQRQHENIFNGFDGFMSKAIPAMILGGATAGLGQIAGFGAAGGVGELSGMDLAADAALGSGNNIVTAGSQLGGGAGLLGSGAAAGGSPNLTPAAMESLIGTPGYGANASADLLVGAGNSGGNALMGFDSISNPGLWDGTAMGEPAAQSVEVVGRRLPPIPEPSAAGGVAAVAPQLGGMEYSNEGRNYPDTQSTQGPGGSPVNAGQTPAGFNWQGLLDKAMQNPRLIGAVAGGLLGGAEGGSGGGGGGAGAYTGPMPTITRGDWSPTAKATMMDVPKFGGLLPQTGQANSGLWRFKG